MKSVPYFLTAVSQCDEIGHGPSRRGNIHKNKLAERFQASAEGQWSSLFRHCRQYAEEASVAQHRQRRRYNPQQDLDRRAARAEGLVQMGELSAGRQAFSVAPGSRRTLDVLRDPLRRPPEPRDPIPVPIVTCGTRGATRTSSVANVRSDGRDAHLLSVAQQLARGRISPPIGDASGWAE